MDTIDADGASIMFRNQLPQGAGYLAECGVRGDSKRKHPVGKDESQPGLFVFAGLGPSHGDSIPQGKVVERGDDWVRSFHLVLVLQGRRLTFVVSATPVTTALQRMAQAILAGSVGIYSQAARSGLSDST